MGLLQDIKALTSTIGKAGLNALYPNEFEYYIVTLELTDSTGKTVEYLTFPITPDALTHTSKNLTNVKKTLGGVTAIDIEGFVPTQLSISGTFGRHLKIIANQAESISSDNSSINGYFNPKTSQQLELKTAIFNSKIKTGYGTIKLLEALINKSTSLDANNRPHKLFYYSPAQGYSYLIKVMNLELDQDMGSNMLWKYTLTIETLAPAFSSTPTQENNTALTKSMKLNVLQRTGNIIVNNLKRSLF